LRFLTSLDQAVGHLSHLLVLDARPRQESANEETEGEATNGKSSGLLAAVSRMCVAARLSARRSGTTPVTVSLAPPTFDITASFLSSM
jgi:hypothetical protein